MEKALSQKDDMIRNLRADCKLLLAKLTKTSADLANERDKHSAAYLAWDSKYQALEQEIAEIGTKLFLATAKLSSCQQEAESRAEDALDQRMRAESMLAKAEAALNRHLQ